MSIVSVDWSALAATLQMERFAMNKLIPASAVLDHVSRGLEQTLQFEILGEAMGLTAQIAGFMVCQVLSVPLALVVAWTVQSPTVWKLLDIGFAAVFGVLLFGSQVLYPVLYTVLMFILLKMGLLRSGVVCALFFMSFSHVYRMMIDTGVYKLDFTGPLMVMMIKTTTLSMKVLDGTVQQSDVSFFDYLAFMWHFHSYNAGPAMQFHEYIRHVNDPNRTPPSLWNVVTKVLHAFACISLFVFASGQFTAANGWFAQDIDLVNSDTLYAQPMFTRILYPILFMYIHIHKYFFTWILADAACNAAGWGKDNKGGWTALSNVITFSVYFPMNMREVFASWNIKTGQWLGYMGSVKGIPKYMRVFMSFALSAVWHGFYPGYFLSFLTAGFQVVCARGCYRHIRPRVIATNSALLKRAYDLAGMLTTIFCVSYTGLMFNCANANYEAGGMRYWKSVYFAGHLIPALSLLLPYVMPYNSKSTKKHE